MDLQELLKKHFGDDEKITALLDDMKTNKIYTSGEENIDVRYNKLKGNYDALINKDKEAQALIEQLKANSANSEETKAKISDYEVRIAELEAQNKQMAIDNAIKFELLAKGAKANDIDYLIYRAKNSDTEIKLDKDGNVKGLEDLVDGLKKNYSGNFEESEKKKVDVKDLPKDEEDKPTVSADQFKKMNYRERNKLYTENKELYEQLTKGQENG